jgi:hypothetical protein
MKEGTRLIIDGVPYRILSAAAGSLGRHMLVIEHDNSAGTEFRESMSALMERLSDDSMAEDKMKISRLVIDWFTDEKLKTGINTSQIIAIKAKPDAARNQIRRLMRSGENIETIIEVLAYSITDKFWSGILNTSINTVAIPRQDGMTLYEKIKSKMIAERQAGITEVHQETEDEMLGVIVVE